jgi:hypothetical protein
VRDEGTRLWAVTKDGRQVACVVRLTSYGIDVDILQDGRLAVTRTFATEDEALAWANDRRVRREAEGWIPSAPADERTDG